MKKLDCYHKDYKTCYYGNSCQEKEHFLLESKYCNWCDRILPIIFFLNEEKDVLCYRHYYEEIRERKNLALKISSNLEPILKTEVFWNKYNKSVYNSIYNTLLKHDESFK